MSVCIDCGKSLSRKEYKRCPRCFGRKTGERYESLRALKRKCCVDCGVRLSKNKYIRCAKCRGKIQKKNWLCRSCGVQLKKGSIRCWSCYKKEVYRRKQNVCLDCQKPISFKSQRCIKCNGVVHSRRIGGSNAPGYIDGRSFEKYPNIFNDRLKKEIRERDLFTCQNCEMTEEEHLIVSGRVLEAHHIDYNKQNCDISNLITLCRWCNTRANYNRLFWEEHYSNKISLSISVRVRRSPA